MRLVVYFLGFFLLLAVECRAKINMSYALKCKAGPFQFVLSIWEVEDIMFDDELGILGGTSEGDRHNSFSSWIVVDDGLDGAFDDFFEIYARVYTNCNSTNSGKWKTLYKKLDSLCPIDDKVCRRAIEMELVGDE